MNVINGIVVEIEGIDNAGKTTLAKYLNELSKNTININDSGIISKMIYDDKINRNSTFILPYKPVIILLDANDEDQTTRNIVNNLDTNMINKDKDSYRQYASHISNQGVPVFMYNTSDISLYKIAKDIIDRLANAALYDFILIKPITINSLNLY